MATRMVYSPEFPEGQRVTLTAEEVAVREAIVNESNEKIAAKQAAADAKAATDAQTVIDQGTGNTKLLGLGLTQAEATALTGYTPPAV